jgi:hypothetical protein
MFAKASIEASKDQAGRPIVIGMGIEEAPQRCLPSPRGARLGVMARRSVRA